MNRADFERVADSIVAGLQKGASLETGVIQAADQRKLNPEQIKRLIEVTNTQAFLSKYKSLSGDDRMVDFEVADPKRVLGVIYGKSNPDSGEKTVTIKMTTSDESDFFADVRDELRQPEGSDTPPAAEKAASVYEPEASPMTSRIGKFAALRLKEALLDKIAEAEHTASDLAEELAGAFRGIYSTTKLAAFEADCLSLFGENAVPALAAIRGRVSSDPSMDFSRAKTAALNRVVDGTGQLFRNVESYMSKVSDFKTYTGALSHLESALGERE